MLLSEGFRPSTSLWSDDSYPQCFATPLAQDEHSHPCSSNRFAVFLQAYQPLHPPHPLRCRWAVRIAGKEAFLKGPNHFLPELATSLPHSPLLPPSDHLLSWQLLLESSFLRRCRASSPVRGNFLPIPSCVSERRQSNRHGRYYKVLAVVEPRRYSPP